jgi:Mg-chelatase subunit ChlD
VIETASSIIELLDEDEEVGVIVFDEIVDSVHEMRVKRGLIARLQSIEPRGDTNIGLGMTIAISILQNGQNVKRKIRIIFIADATPTIGETAPMIRDETKRAFQKPKGMIGVTYIRIG